MERELKAVFKIEMPQMRQLIELQTMSESG